jgi:hypothetical protein
MANTLAYYEKPKFTDKFFYNIVPKVQVTDND